MYLAGGTLGIRLLPPRAGIRGLGNGSGRSAEFLEECLEALEEVEPLRSEELSGPVVLVAYPILIFGPPAMSAMGFGLSL
jgi:hypothetical protein